MQASPL